MRDRDEQTGHDEPTGRDEQTGRDEPTDPAAVELIVVHEADLVAAVEASDRTSRRTVLRITPPFVARMRARLHVEQLDASGPAVHVPPRAMVENVPPFPGDDAAEWRTRVADAVCNRLDDDRVSQLASPRIVTLGE